MTCFVRDEERQYRASLSYNPRYRYLVVHEPASVFGYIQMSAQLIMAQSLSFNGQQLSYRVVIVREVTKVVPIEETS